MRPGITTPTFCDCIWTAFYYVVYLVFNFTYISACAILITIAAITYAGHREALRLTRAAIRGYGKMVLWMASPRVHLHVDDRSNHQWGRPCMIISNHQSVVDIFVLGGLPHECVFISNRWPFRVPVLGFFARLAGYLSIESLGLDELVSRAMELKAEGVSLVSFPEGTRTRTGALGQFHATPFRIAQQMEVPILPVCISGNFNVLQPKQYWLRGGDVTLRLLPLIEPETYRDLSPHQLKQRTHQVIASELAAMEGAAA